MFVSEVSDFLFVGKVEPYFLSDGEVVVVVKNILIFFRQNEAILKKLNKIKTKRYFVFRGEGMIGQVLTSSFWLSFRSYYRI